MNPNYQTFIIEMIKHGDKQRAYHKTYPKAKGESAIKGAERLLRNSQIAAEISEAVSAIHADAYAKACKVHAELKEVKILSIMKKREILNQLATCEMKVGRYVKGQYDYVMVYEDPRPRDIIRAIELDTKLEEMLNNARNIEDVKLSRFDIYIDGRPCDDPTAPINPSIPKGLVMLPRKKKNIPEFTGNKREQNSLEIIENEELSLFGGAGVGDSRQTPAQEISPASTGNKKEHPDSNRTPETLTADMSPAGGGVRLSADGGGMLTQEISPEFTGNKKEQKSSETLCLCDSAVKNPLVHEPETLTLKTQLLYEKQQRREKDPMYDSFYKDFVRRREQAPPPRVYTDEEIQAIKETGSPERPLDLEAISIPKSGKMIFTEKKYMDDGL